MKKTEKSKNAKTCKNIKKASKRANHTEFRKEVPREKSGRSIEKTEKRRKRVQRERPFVLCISTMSSLAATKFIILLHKMRPSEHRWHHVMHLFDRNFYIQSKSVAEKI